MKALDRLLQSWRIAKARPYIPPGARLLDVGCHDGSLFRQLSDRIGDGVGIDPELETARTFCGAKLLPGIFPDDLGAESPFDAITMLAMIEHVPTERLPALARACSENLASGGVLIVTVPAPAVDVILALLKALRLIDGMSLEQHHGFHPHDTIDIFSDLELVVARRFQLGLNYLFVFRKVVLDPDGGSPSGCGDE